MRIQDCGLGNLLWAGPSKQEPKVSAFQGKLQFLFVSFAQDCQKVLGQVRMGGKGHGHWNCFSEVDKS